MRLKVNKLSIERQSLDRVVATPNNINILQQPLFNRTGSSASNRSQNQRYSQEPGSIIRSAGGSQQQKLFSNKSPNNGHGSQQPRLFSGNSQSGSGVPLVRKSGASGLPKSGGGGMRMTRPGSAIEKGHRQLVTNHQKRYQFSSYKLDACELLGNRIHKKLRQHFSQIKAFASYREVSPYIQPTNVL